MATKRNAIQRREELIDQTEHMTQHQPKIGPSNSLKIKLDHLQTFSPLTPNQEKFFEMYRGGAYCIGLFGSPGVGKSFLAMYRALEEVLDKSTPYKQVVVIRSTVPSREIGFLPGTEEEKIAIYELPYREIAQTLFNRPDAWDRLKEQGHARFISSSFVRGISIDDSIIIVEEAQNYTWQELSSVITRTGHRSKIIFTGDLFQNDLVRQKNDQSGLEMILDVLRSMEEFQEIYFTPDDIVRSSLVKKFIQACAKKGLLPG